MATNATSATAPTTAAATKPNILQTIIAHKALEVAEDKIALPLESFIADAVPTTRNFLQALTAPGARFILECKKASPSKGLIRANFDLTEIAGVYGKYADCISVLTDKKFFQGSYDYLKTMRGLVDQPLLHKDFIIDEYQIYRGRACGADAVLLMLSVLDDTQYQQLAALAHRLNMTVLTEVSNEDETLRAVALKAELIGINNRNLRTLETDLNTSFRLARLVPPSTPLVSESGIYFNHQVRQLGKVATAFLVGSSLMAEPDLDRAVHALTRGEHKVCGLTTPEQAQQVAEAGAMYGGLIFYPPSPRFVTQQQAKIIRDSAPLRFVGVFVNEAPAQVALVARELKLSAVQLHGDEDESYIAGLKTLLPKGCEIWQAYRVKDTLPQFSHNADRILLDAYQPGIPGGTGLSFDWNLLGERILHKPVMLAGGLNPDNVQHALKTAASGLDMNSGLESAPGVKDPAKIITAFQRIREFSFGETSHDSTQA
jgi:indole-3-glycerol phosphate synthase/phosphoribosylanthranilate isomerase